MRTPYMQHLVAHQAQIQNAIEQVFSRFRVVVVSNGYIDLIVSLRDAPECIAAVAELPVAVERLTWWCLCRPESAQRLGCPHGMGGPRNPWGAGYLSECVGYPDFEVENHGVALDRTDSTPEALARACRAATVAYLATQLPREPWFSPCLHVGLWLHVPDDWLR